MKPKLILCLALVLGGCATKPVYPLPQSAIPEPGIYLVQHGDNAQRIAKNLCLSVERLAQLNPDVDLAHLKVGQRLYYTSASTNLNLTERCYELDLKSLAAGQFHADGLGKFSGDAFDDKIPAALQIAEQLPQVRTNDYEPCLLNVPPILFVAVWLHGRSDDIIIPLPPTFDRWTAYKPYSQKEMVELLKPHAQKKLKEASSFD